MSEETLALEEDLGFEEAPGDLTEGSFEVVQDFLDPTEYDMSTQEADPELVEDPLLYEELDDEVPTVEVEEDPEAIVLDFTSNAPTGTTTPYTPDDLDVEESGVEGEVVQVEAPTPGAVNQAPEFDQDFTPVGYEPAVPTTVPPEYQAAMEQMKFETGQAEEVIFETQAEVAEVRADAAEAHGLASDATLAAQEAHNAAVDAQGAADAAQTAAGNAQTTAGNALVSANGRNSRVTSTDDPSGTTNPNTGLAWVDGDTWWKWDSTTARNVIGAWTYRNGKWEAEKIRDEVLASLDLNKLVVTGSARMTQAVVDKIIGDAAFFKSITASKLAVIPGEEFPDPFFLDEDAWGPASGVSLDEDSNMPGGRRLTLTGTGGQVGTYYNGLDDRSLPLEAGAQYRVRFTLRRGGSAPGVSNVTRVYFYVRGNRASDGGVVTRATAINVPATSSYNYGVVEGVVTVPEDWAGMGTVGFYTTSVDTTGVTLYFGGVSMKRMVGGVLIEPGGINTPHLATGALNYVNAFGMTLTSAEIISPDIKTATSGARVELTTAGLRAFNDDGDVTASIWGNGGILQGTTITGGTVRTAASGARIQMTGGLFQVVNSSGREIIKIAPEWQPPGSIPKQPALVFAENVAGSPARMVMYGGDMWFMNGSYVIGSLRKSPGTDMYLENNDGSTNTRITNVGTQGNIYIDAGSGGIYNSSNWHDFNVVGAASGYRSWAIRPITLGGISRAVLQFTGGGDRMPQTTLAGNMFIDSNGNVFRGSASALRLKTDIRDISTNPSRILGVRVRDWKDKGAVASGDLEGQIRVPGVIAEELEDLGLEQFVTYDEDGQTSGVLYDRLPLLLIPVVRDLHDRLERLENQT